MTIFIKPNNAQFCIAVFETIETWLKLSRVAFIDSEVETCNFLCQYQDIVEAIFFDGTIHAQTAIGIREKTYLPIRIYKEKGDVHDRIEAQQEWLSANVKYNKEMKDANDYMRFIRFLSDYKRTNPNSDTIAADLMADAAKYFRVEFCK